MATKTDDTASIDNPNDGKGTIINFCIYQCDIIAKLAIFLFLFLIPVYSLKGESLDKEILTISGDDDGSHRIPSTYLYNTGSEQGTGISDQEQSTRIRNQGPEDQLGPLPSNWEKAFTDTREVYFIEYVYSTRAIVK